MATDTAPHHHVLILPGARFEIPEVVKDLARLLDEHPVDLGQKLRYGGGWVVRSAPLHLAKRVLEILERHHVRSAMLAADRDGEPTSPTIKEARSVTFDGQQLVLGHPTGDEHIPIERIAVVDLIALGDPEAREHTGDAGLDRSLRLLGSVSSGFPFDGQRSALLAGDLLPMVHIVTAQPLVFHRIARGALFPHYAEVMGGLWLDNLLTFLHHLLPALPPGRVFPGTREFWNGSLRSGLVARPASQTSQPATDPVERRERDDDDSGNARIRSILIEKHEELGNRLTWLAEITARDLWGDPR